MAIVTHECRNNVTGASVIFTVDDTAGKVLRVDIDTGTARRAPRVTFEDGFEVTTSTDVSGRNLPASQAKQERADRSEKTVLAFGYKVHF